MPKKLWRRIHQKPKKLLDDASKAEDAAASRLDEQAVRRKLKDV